MEKFCLRVTWLVSLFLRTGHTVESRAPCTSQHVLGATHPFRRSWFKVSFALASPDLTQLAFCRMVIVEKLDVDSNALQSLSFALIHHQQVESTSVALGRFRQDFAGTFGRNSIGPCADRARGEVHGALSFPELCDNMTVNVLIIIQEKHCFVVPSDMRFVLEIRWIATVAHPNYVPVKSVGSVNPALLSGKLQNFFRDFARLLSDFGRPIDVVFQHKGRSPPVLHDELEHIYVGQSSQRSPACVNIAEQLKGIHERAGPFGLFGNEELDVTRSGCRHQPLCSPRRSFAHSNDFGELLNDGRLAIDREGSGTSRLTASVRFLAEMFPANILEESEDKGKGEGRGGS